MNRINLVCRALCVKRVQTLLCDGNIGTTGIGRDLSLIFPGIRVFERRD